MATICVKPCNVIGSIYLPMKVAFFTCYDSPSQSGSISHPFSQGLIAHRCSKRRKQTTRLNFGPMLRSIGDATERSSNVRSVVCEGHTSRRAEIEDYGYDLYELLGVEKNATVQDIKGAYRWLQKRCHPDIAGIAGHDMSILLNEAYSILADPIRRASYDATCADRAEFEGFTGGPLYSRWYGPPGEDRAIFVEESRCVGCLKCALIAPNTFAIENTHGRARAVGQWADDESTIKDAIRACPVDCISWVERGRLPALEFIMSKQPRLPVGIDNYSYVGKRMENVFVGAEKFQKKCEKREEKQASMANEETAAQREARMAAAEAIHTRAGRWWHHLMDNQAFTNGAFSTGNFANLWDPTSTRVAQGALIPLRTSQSEETNVSNTASYLNDADLERLLEAAKQMRRSGTKNFSKLRGASSLGDEEYWSPMKPISCPLPEYREVAKGASKNKVAETLSPHTHYSGKLSFEDNLHEGMKIIMRSMPVMISVAAAVFVGMAGGSEVARSETDFIAGPLPAAISSGIAMHMFLAAAVWYMIGAAVCEATVFMSAYFISLRKEE